MEHSISCFDVDENDRMKLFKSKGQWIHGVVVKIHGVNDLDTHIAFVTHHQTEDLSSNCVENVGKPEALQMLDWSSCLPTESDCSDGKAAGSSSSVIVHALSLGMWILVPDSCQCCTYSPAT